MRDRYREAQRDEVRISIPLEEGALTAACRYDEKRSISRLQETFIAKSNAAQRRGRAGRVQEGLAFHLFTRARHDTQVN